MNLNQNTQKCLKFLIEGPKIKKELAKFIYGSDDDYNTSRLNKEILKPNKSLFEFPDPENAWKDNLTGRLKVDRRLKVVCLDWENFLKLWFSHLSIRKYKNKFLSEEPDKEMHTEIEKKILKIIFKSKWFRERIFSYDDLWLGIENVLIEGIIQNLWYLKKNKNKEIFCRFFEIRCELEEGRFQSLEKYSKEKLGNSNAKIIFQFHHAEDLIKVLPDSFIIKILKYIEKPPLSLVILTDFKEIFEELYWKQDSKFFKDKGLESIIEKYKTTIKEVEPLELSTDYE